jgi:hypothetical protein
MEIKGTVKMIGQTVQVSDKFSKRELVLVTDEKYPQSILVEFNQDACSLLDPYAVGSKVGVKVNIRGREWVNPKDGQVKYFNTIQGWQIGYTGEHADAIQGEKHNRDIMANDLIDDELSDLPF